MGITKYDIRIGNMFEQGIVWKISGRAGAKVHLHGKGKWYNGFRQDISVYDLKPILLTPEVLVGWCGFERDTMGWLGGDGYKKDIFSLTPENNGTRCLTRKDNVVCEINYLHELQNLWYVLNKEELEING